MNLAEASSTSGGGCFSVSSAQSSSNASFFSCHLAASNFAMMPALKYSVAFSMAASLLRPAPRSSSWTTGAVGPLVGAAAGFFGAGFYPMFGGGLPAGFLAGAASS